MFFKSKQKIFGPEPSAFSRGRFGSPLGKRTEEVNARVVTEVKDELQRACAALGMNESEFISALLEVRFFGIGHAVTLHEDRIKVVAGIGNE